MMIFSMEPTEKFCWESKADKANKVTADKAGVEKIVKNSP